MQKKESLSLAYEYDFIGGEKNTFSFETIHEVTYEITFKSTPYLFGEDSIFTNYIFEFSIVLVNNPLERNPPSDAKIGPTIAAIFTDFYENSPKTIAVYICDSSDGRQLLRQRKFNDWFNYYKGPRFVKLDAEFKETNGTPYPVSLIIKHNHPYRVQIFDEFLNVVYGYNAGK
jgi:Family of unknown function (DUF6169)